MSDAPTPAPAVAVTLPNEQEVGVFADFAAIWHTPSTFVLDFLSLVSPAGLATGPDGETRPIVSAKVAARVRVPAEQVFRVIDALREQADQWLAETGRTEPPAGWSPDL